MLNDIVISYIRTIVPVIVGAVVGWLQPFGIDVDSQAAISLLIAISSGLYYAIARYLEQKSSRFGWLLGVPAPPKYDH